MHNSHSGFRRTNATESVERLIVTLQLDKGDFKPRTAIISRI